MALVAEETKIVTIDGQARAVETLPDNARQLVRFYDDWKQKELDARSALLLAQTGMRALGNEIAAAVKQADDEAAAATEGSEVVEDTAPANDADGE